MKAPALFPKSALPRALEAGFSAFWAAYPSRKPNPRALAEKEFTACVKAGVTPEMLAQAATAYAAEVKAKQVAEPFIVHAATFLRQARYLDYLATPEAPIGTPAEPEHPLWPKLKGDMDLATFNAWIGRCQYSNPGGNPGDFITLVAPTHFIGTRVSEAFGALLKRRCGPISIIIPARTAP